MATNSILSVNHITDHLDFVDGEIRLESKIVSNGLGQKSHKNFRRNILEKYEQELGELGGVFKTPLESGEVVWYLNEDQTNFVITLVRNSAITVRFKLNLVKAFAKKKADAKTSLTHRQIIDACIIRLPEKPWRRRFEPEFYEQLERLTGLKARGNTRPQYWGRLTKELVYQYLPSGVSQELYICKEETGGWRKLHEYLSEDGLIIFTRHMDHLFSLMLASSSISELKRLLNQSKTGSYQLLLLGVQA